MNTSVTTHNSTKDQDLNVQLRDLVAPLGFAKHQQAFRKFETFAKLLSNSPNQKYSPYKSDIYTDSTTWRVVDTFVMTRMCAINFATHQNIKSRFETFKSKLLKNTQVNEKNYHFKSYSYGSSQFTLVESYMLPREAVHDS